MNVKINKEQVGKIIVGVGKVTIYGLSCLALIAPHVENSVGAMKRLTAKANYSGAIRAILNSDMLGSYMKEAVEVVQKDRDEDYYKSIIEIVESNMLGSYKIDMIKKISQA
jgi:methenyltetrahydromethanopterin cyclohydrolase